MIDPNDPYDTYVDPHSVFGISLYEAPGFVLGTTTRVDDNDALETVQISYTHKATNTTLWFIVSAGRNPHTEGHYVISAYRDSGSPLQNPVAHALLEADKKTVPNPHSASMFFGRDMKRLHPIVDASNSDEYRQVLDSVIYVMWEALETMDTNVTGITEDSAMNKKLAAVLELDRVLMEYQDLLQEEPLD